MHNQYFDKQMSYFLISAILTKIQNYEGILKVS